MSQSRFVFRNGVECLALLVLAACQTQQVPTDTEPAGLAITALDRYVQAPDSNYTYTLAATIEGEGYTTYVLDMISQAWLTDKEVDRPRCALLMKSFHASNEPICLMPGCLGRPATW